MKRKSTDYILGFITGMSIMFAVWSCTNPLNATVGDVIYVEVVNGSWNPVNVKNID